MAHLLPYLDAASAHPDFKRDVLQFQKGESVERIRIGVYAPRVKVERVLTQLLSAHPDLVVERVSVHGRSGCSDFSGELQVIAGGEERLFHFTWCCAWRAEQEQWRDCFGFWDQQRAAREFGWDCFQKWEQVSSAAMQPA